MLLGISANEIGMTESPFFARVNRRAETALTRRPGSNHEKPFGRFSMDKTTSCVVYWLHDDRCICPWRHGYIGKKERTAAAVKKAVKGINRLQRHYRKHGQLDFDL
jgi:hypothetical protein